MFQLRAIGVKRSESRPETMASDKVLEDARRFVQQAEALLERKRALSDETRDQGEGLLRRLRDAVSNGDTGAMKERTQDLSAWVVKHEGVRRKSTAREYGESILLAVVIALFLRAFVVEAFKIPSESMLPTLKIGDHIFVNKFVYGLRMPFTFIKFAEWSIPERGDVVVFINPEDEKLDYIKRVVGIPGDMVEMRDNRLHVNGAPVDVEPGESMRYRNETAHVQRERLGDEWHELLTSRVMADYGPEQVRPGHVFVMGDNRGNSSDSRVIGQIPLTHVKGKAMIIWWSVGPPDGVRWGRIGSLIP
jgi:signal peptidase I